MSCHVSLLLIFRGSGPPRRVTPSAVIITSHVSFPSISVYHFHAIHFLASLSCSLTPLLQWIFSHSYDHLLFVLLVPHFLFFLFRTLSTFFYHYLCKAGLPRSVLLYSMSTTFPFPSYRSVSARLHYHSPTLSSCPASTFALRTYFSPARFRAPFAWFQFWRFLDACLCTTLRTLLLHPPHAVFSRLVYFSQPLTVDSFHSHVRFRTTTFVIFWFFRAILLCSHACSLPSGLVALFLEDSIFSYFYAHYSFDAPFLIVCAPLRL